MARGDKPDPERDRRRQEREEAIARQKAIGRRVQQLFDTATNRAQQRRPDDLPDRAEIIARLEEARRLALLISNPQAAVMATVAQAKVMGLIVERAAIVSGTPDDFRNLSEEELRLRLSDRYGSHRAQRVLETVKQVRAALRGDHDPLAIERDDEGSTDG